MLKEYVKKSSILSHICKKNFLYTYVNLTRTFFIKIVNVMSPRVWSLTLGWGQNENAYNF